MKYGTVTWLPNGPTRKRPHWLVQCQPHVMLFLKRVFERVDKAQHGSVLIQDTPETSRHLLWFMDLHPMQIEPADLATLQERAELHRQIEQRAAFIMSEEYQSPGQTQLKLPPRQYQQQAADLACTTGQLLLGDDLGLGKTVSAIAALAQQGKFPVLVVTLTHLPKQWQRELARFCPDLTTHILEKGTAYDLAEPRKKKRGRAVNEADAMPDVIITNYHKLSGWADYLAELPVQAVVYDEVQELRRGESKAGYPTQKYAAAEYISQAAQMRMGLSATPVYNYGSEIFFVLNAVAPSALGTKEEFRREYCYSRDQKWLLKDPAAFGTYLRASGLILRRTRQDVGRELPSLTTIEHEVDINLKAGTFGADLAGLAQVILAAEEVERGDKFRAAGQFDYQLRRETGMAKAAFTADFVRMLVENGESVVLYGWHHDVYQVWRNSLRDLDPAFYTGKESAGQKELQINRFKDGKTKVAILSLRAGAGLDGLQHVCRTVVFGELDWSPGVHEQAIGRVHRDGQPDPVCAYFLTADFGSDPIIADTLGVKRGQISGLRDPDAPILETGLDPNHIKKLAASFLVQRGQLPSDYKLPEEEVPVFAPAPASEDIQLDLLEAFS